MFAVLMFLPLVVVTAVQASLWKLAARILRYGEVTWPMAFLTAITIVAIAGFIRGGLTYLGVQFPVFMAVVFGPVVPVVLGAWCFHDRATRQDGKLAGWTDALKLSALALVLFALSGLLLWAVLMAIVSRDS